MAVQSMAVMSASTSSGRSAASMVVAKRRPPSQAAPRAPCDRTPARAAPLPRSSVSNGSGTVTADKETAAPRTSPPAQALPRGPTEKMIAIPVTLTARAMRSQRSGCCHRPARARQYRRGDVHPPAAVDAGSATRRRPPSLRRPAARATADARAAQRYGR